MLRFLIGLLKVIAVFVLITAACLYFLANHSERQTELTCDGMWVQSSEPEILYVVLSEYQPWIFWGDSDGTLKAQTDKLSMSIYVPRVDRIGDGSLALYSLWDGYPEKSMIGGYRVANSEITLQFGSKLTFTGKCRPRAVG